MKKLSGLELCRFLSAVAVMLWHYQHFFVSGVWIGGAGLTDRTGFPLYRVLSPFYDYGWMAVQVFWAMSGYILVRKYGEAIKTGRVSAEDFCVLRLSRLYPLHVSTLLVVVVLQTLYRGSHGVSFIYDHNDLPHLALQLAMASNWFVGQPLTFNGPIWSVSDEVLTYAVFFAVVRFQLSNAWLCALAGAFACLGAYFTGSPVMACCVLFFIGGLCSIMTRRLEGARAVMVFAAALVTAVTIAWFLLEGHILSFGHQIAFAVATVLTFALLEEVLRCDLSRFAALGNLTYASYLIHFPLQLATVLCLDALGVGRGVFASPIALALFLATTLGLAAVVYRGFERPAQALVRSWWAERREGRAAPAGASRAPS